MGQLGGCCAGVTRGWKVSVGLCLCEGNRLSRGPRWSGLVIWIQLARAAVITVGLFCGWGRDVWTLLSGDVRCVSFELSNVAVFWRCVCILSAAVCTANGIPRLKDRHVDSWVVIAWACFCWRDSGGFVIASLSLTFGVAELCGCLNFGRFQDVGRNSCGGIPWPRWCVGGLLHGGKRLLPPML
ncbi:hypothetical protein NDU88_003706 [Pleurodeles waltl]|uniref:Uncharacterized protein n=1 Tax=Pleurodeles waltl TaxID=8319 RepID=A0AAV7LG12_PLEWA|nr:hypothetical protein NDU88_003706 [Pleurodeles waltl]